MRKSLFLLAFSLIFFCSRAQVQQIKLKDGPLLQSLDWFIDLTRHYIDSVSRVRDSEIPNALGIIRIRLFGAQDSLTILPIVGGKELVEIIEKRTFIISMVPYNVMLGRLPSFYFFRQNIPVLVDTGWEPVFVSNELGDWETLKKDQLSKFREFKNVPGLDDYLIEINDLTKANFNARKYYSK